MNGQFRNVRDLPATVERLARWWTSASPQERFTLLLASFHKSPEAPPLALVQVASILAEEAAGEVAQG